MKKIADLWYMAELSVNMTVSTYFEVAESKSGVYFIKFDNRTTRNVFKVKIERKIEGFSGR